MSIAVSIIIGAFLLLMVVPRVLMAVKTARLKGQEAPTPHKASAKRIKGGQKTVLYFYTPTCRACTMQDPIIQKVMKKHGSAIYKIDASKEQAAASAYGVMGVPFVAYIEDGKVVNARAGVQSEETLTAFLAG